MLCKNPFVRDPSGRMFKVALLAGDSELAIHGIPFPCGQCLPCRINRRRVWTHRLMLESYMHADSIFVTLTYSPEYLPPDLSIHKRDLQLFLKRFRRAVEPRRIRYYACGEYGEHTHRPHYHAILFGASEADSETVNYCWGLGMTHVGTFSQHSAQYVAGYVTKKFIKKGDGVEKEFSLMSRKPGLGYPALADVVRLLDNPQFQEFLRIKGDVPDGLRHGQSFFPFGRFLADKLRRLMDMTGDIDAFIREMRAKYVEAKFQNKELSEFLIDESRQKNRQIESRFKLYSKGGSL